MTENPHPGQTEATAAAPGDHPPVTKAEETIELTGHPAVDDVLETMHGLQDRPVEEHVAVFEAAHEKLRVALTDAGDQANPAGS